MLRWILALEKAGRHLEAVQLCEASITGEEIPEIQFALARNLFVLASGGDETNAWPALLAALDGIEAQCGNQPEVAHAVGICRWVLDLFGDPHRIDVRGFTERSGGNTMAAWWCGGIGGQESPGGVQPPEPDELEALLRRGEYVRLANAMLAAAPTRIRFQRSEGWVAREARYLLANLLTTIAGERVAGLLSPDRFPISSDREGQPYENYLFTAAQEHRTCVRARARGVPGILIASLPKSASEFLSSTLATALRAAIVRVTIGDPFLGTVSAAWAAEVTAGGCVTHDHFAGSEQNLAALRDAGVKRVVVQVRDPRAVFWSLQRMQWEYDRQSLTPDPDGRKACQVVRMLANWIETWIRARTAGYPVTFVRFKELTTEPTTVMRRILEESGAGRFAAELNEVLRRRQEQDRPSNNFRTGDDEAWRIVVSPEQTTEVWEVIPPSVRDLLELKP
jgi:hypothetical protein